MSAMMRYLTEPEQRELLKAPKSQACPLAQRDHHWIGALILTGMRITEFSCLTVPMVRQALATGWLVSDKNDCKGKRKANSYCVTIQLRGHLEALVKISDSQAQMSLLIEQPLIWGRDNAAPLSVRSYEARLKHWAVAAGLDASISPHWLRHTRGMNVMKNHRGGDALKVAQLALGHASLRSTGIYTHMSKEDLATALQAVDSSSGRMRKADAVRLAQGARA